MSASETRMIYRFHRKAIPRRTMMRGVVIRNPMVPRPIRYKINIPNTIPIFLTALVLIDFKWFTISFLEKTSIPPSFKPDKKSKKEKDASEADTTFGKKDGGNPYTV